LGLPDEEYYRLDTYADLRAEYRTHLTTMLELADVDDPTDAAEQVFELESAIASLHWDKVRCRDLRAMYNPMTLAELETAAPGLRWRDFLDGAGIDERAMADLVVAQPSFITELPGLLTEDRLPAWRAWARWRVVTSL
ncbi:hypothetical protein I6F37_41825, partial [Bradyrhizobium sp. NBAIM08]